MPVVSRVVAGTSGSPGSLVALRYAEFLALAHDAVLVPVLAWEPPGNHRLPAGEPLMRIWRQAASERMRAALVAVWGQVPADPRVQPLVERGLPGLVLVSIACQPGDVLVVGAGRRGALRRAASCAVSRYCAARACCPVVLVPPPDLAREVRHGPIARELRRRAVTPARITGAHHGPAAG